MLVRVLNLLGKVGLFVASVIISEHELCTKGTITGLTLIPILCLVIWMGAEMVVHDLKEMKDDDMLAPDDSEAEDDVW